MGGCMIMLRDSMICLPLPLPVFNICKSLFAVEGGCWEELLNPELYEKRKYYQMELSERTLPSSVTVIYLPLYLILLLITSDL